ncbi:GNAT family N-acetyltransferase [Chloroflexia bacterium SDU3-3]|nr:GNAT family N-acetyltransferase [Chloroflexia bacterium SDU3-3]
MDLHSARVRIRYWQHRDDIEADAWPPYNDPLEPIWNLPRMSGGWGGFDFSPMRRAWAVDTIDRQLAGRISLREIDQRRSSARLGVTFGAPFVGRGLGTEAMALFLDYYFSELGFQLMVLDVAAPNVRAVRCYERLGFSHVGTDWRTAGQSFNTRLLESPLYEPVRKYFRQGPRYVDVQFFEMELPRQEWLQRSPQLHQQM